MTGQEKAAGVLDTPEAAQDTKRRPILSLPSADGKEFDTVAAKFALRGHELCRVETDHRSVFYVSHHGQARVLTSWHDVKALLVQIGGAV